MNLSIILRIVEFIRTTGCSVEVVLPLMIVA